MADEQKQVVNDSAAASTPAATQEVKVTTPAVENTAAKTPEKVPYNRFKEVIEKGHEKDSEIAELRARLQAVETQRQPVVHDDSVVRHVKALMARGMDESNARAIAETAHSIALEQSSHLAKAVNQRDMGLFVDNFKKNTKDYDELEPLMLEQFRNMPKHKKDAVVTDPDAFQDLYFRIKVNVLEQKLAGKFEEGKSAAYETKGLKEALAAKPGAVATTENALTLEVIDKLDMTRPADKAFYLKNKAEIHRLMNEGKLR